ncbi:MAG: metal ABC transporter permease [Candidatus Azambacteria bacterium]|nr:metal ABC transporter permease [Candidatus Azambacteria bacterium]
MDPNLFIVSAVIAGAASFLGVFVILRRLALVSDVLSHVALPGVALALLLHIDPFIGAFTALALVTVGIFLIERRFAISIDALVGVAFTVALAIGMILLPDEHAVEALFGDIAHIGKSDMLFGVILGALLIVVTFVLFKRFAHATFSKELSRDEASSDKKAELLFLIALALAIALGIKVVGTLLMGAMLILPVVAAKNIAWSLKSMTAFAVVLGVIEMVGGISVAQTYDVVPGAAIILIGGGVFAASLLFRAFGNQNT